MAKRKNELTIKQEKYVNERIKGKSQRQAYKAAFNPPHSSDKTIDETACRLEETDKIKARLNYLRSINSADSIATKEDLAKELMIIASDLNKSDSIRLKAYDQLAKLQGYNDDHSLVDVRAVVLSATDKASAIKDYLRELTS